MMIEKVLQLHKKRLLALILAAVLVFSQVSFAAVFAAETESGAEVAAQGTTNTSGIYTYEVVNGKAVITDCDGYASGSITIPSKLGGYTVTEIDDDAFSMCSGITSVTIPDTVQRIGESAFYSCNKVTSVIIGNGVTSIEDCAFMRCSALTSLTIGNSVVSIGSAAFRSCIKLTSVSFPNSVQTIGEYAFSFCSALSAVNIGSGVTNIGEGAFYACNAVTAYSVHSGNSYYSSDSYGVLYNKSKTQLIRYPVGNTRTSFTVPSGVTSIGFSAFLSGKNLVSVTIPTGVKTIGESAFEDCSSLTAVTIPNSVTSIGDFAFQRCFKFASVSIGSGVTSIGNLAFYACVKLSTITVNSANSAFCIDNGVLYNKTKTELVQYPQGSTASSYTVPASVRTIRTGALVECNNIKTLTLANGVQKIEWGAIEFCDALEQIEIPRTVTELCYCNIRECNALKHVELPDSITKIEHETIALCSALEYVHVPASVTSITHKSYGWNFLEGTTAYICSETTNCYAKTYADTYGKTFRTCSGHASTASLLLIAVQTMPNKTTYTVGESFDQTGLTLAAAYSDGSIRTITSGFTCTGFSSTTAGTKTITVSYTDGGVTRTDTFTVTVNAPSLTKIAVKTMPDKTTYTVGENFDQTGLTLAAAYADGSTKTVSGGFTCSGFSSTTAGTKTVTVSYTEGGVTKTTTFTVTVTAAALTKIAVKTMPDKTTYTVGENFSQTGLTLTATYADGSTKTVSNGFTCTGFSSTTAGTKTITVSYTEGGVTKTTTFTVTVKPAADTLDSVHWDYKVGSTGKALFPYYESTGSGRIVSEYYYALNTGGTTTYKYHTDPEEARDACTITVSSSDPRVLRVDETTHRLIPVGNGEARLTITATLPASNNRPYAVSKSDSFTVVINDSPYTPITDVGIGFDPAETDDGISFDISSNTITMQNGQKIRLAALLNSGASLDHDTIDVQLSDGRKLRTVSSAEYSWTSSNSRAATVDQNGKVTMTGNGTTTITLTVNDNGISFTKSVNILCRTVRPPEIKIKNYTANKTVDYRTTITFTAEVKNDEGGQVCWFVDGQNKGSGDTYTVKEATKNFTVQAKYMRDGKVLAESEIETVKVNSGFFAKLKAFFRALFGKLPVVVQEYLGVEFLP